MANEKSQDIILESDAPINYGDGETHVKDFLLNNDSPVVIVKDMYGEAIEAVNLVEFEEYMQNEAADAEDGHNFNIVNDYEILYKSVVGNNIEYHAYQGRYTVGKIDIIKNIQENFSPAQSETTMKDLPVFFYEHYQLCRLENSLTNKTTNAFPNLNESIKQERKILNAHEDGKPFYGLKKIEELHNAIVKSKVRKPKHIILNCKSNDEICNQEHSVER